MNSYTELVEILKNRDTNDKKNILKQIENAETLTRKCILTRSYLPPQSTDLETICKNDLKIGKSLNSTTASALYNNTRLHFNSF